MTEAYDPSLDLLYWGVGNPAPAFLGAARPGDNLFTDSVIALRGSSSELAWFFQFTPHDEHDWDSAETPVLAEGVIKGTYRKVICWPNKNGFYYVLDRETGEFLVVVPFVELNWAKGLSPTGRPILSDEGTLTLGASGRTLFALDSATGEELWGFPSGGHLVGAHLIHIGRTSNDCHSGRPRAFRFRIAD